MKKIAKTLMMTTSQPSEYYADTHFPKLSQCCDASLLLLSHVSITWRKSLICDTQEKCNGHGKIFY